MLQAVNVLCHVKQVWSIEIQEKISVHVVKCCIVLCIIVVCSAVQHLGGLYECLV